MLTDQQLTTSAYRILHRYLSDPADTYHPERCQMCDDMGYLDPGRDETVYPEPDSSPEQLAAAGRAALDRIHAISAGENA